MELISIIVPVYNVAQYIEECVGSLTRQTYKNIEIILINDCSKDNSLEICQKLADKDARIKVINNEKNLGVSYTRNHGLQIAKGKYILFVDSDDVVDEQLCELAINEMKVHKVDTVHWGYKKFNDETHKVFYEKDAVMKNSGVITQPDITNKFLPYFTISYDDLYTWFRSDKSFNEIIYNKKQPGYCYRYLMSKKIIDNNNLMFCENVGYGEDLIFVSEYLLCCKSMSIMNKKLYYYRDRPGSAMHSKHSVEEKMGSIMAKNNILRHVLPEEQCKMSGLWKGQTLLVALNGARVHSLKEYKKMLSYSCIREAISDISIKYAPLKYKVAIGLLKLRMVSIYYFIIKILSKGGFKYER